MLRIVESFENTLRKFLKKIKNCRMNERNQLNFIYNDIDIEMRVNDLRCSRNIIIINDYLKKLDEFKYD